MDWIILGAFYLLWAFIFSGGIEVQPAYQKHERIILWAASLTWPVWVVYGLYQRLKA